jgi:hypothetical protein
VQNPQECVIEDLVVAWVEFITLRNLFLHLECWGAEAKLKKFKEGLFFNLTCDDLCDLERA